MDDLTEAVRKFCNNELNNLHSSLNTVEMMQSLTENWQQDNRDSKATIPS
jgi:hypothetical protein